MAKRKRSKPDPMSTPAAEIQFNGKAEDYDRYVKDYNKRLRRLRREAEGWNMEEPDGYYE